MAKVEKSSVGKDTYVVRVDPGEVVVDSGKAYPHHTSIGTFNLDGKINVWTPAGYAPRGWKKAATRMLRAIADESIPLLKKG